MKVKCYLFPGWAPLIRPASSRRAWMDETQESFAYRCLPLKIANSHGWEVLTRVGFDVLWNGGTAPEDIQIIPDEGAAAHELPVPLFGHGTFTFHIQGLFRTPPGWNMWVSGSPNSHKDGAAPLAGIIETDWSPYTFTMNWRLTRANHRVRFEPGEPIAHIFPVLREAIEAFEPEFVPIDEEPDLKAQFQEWSASRDAFQKRVAEHPPTKPSEKWQKFYYRGLNPRGECPVADHKSKLSLQEFGNAGLLGEAGVVPVVVPQAAPAADTGAAWSIAKYEWLMETAERQRALSEAASGIFRAEGLTSEEFLDQFYAPARPVILTGEIGEWPALAKWGPDYLRATLGDVAVEVQAGREGNARFELDKDAHRRVMPFGSFMDAATAGPGNDVYLTAYNAAANGAAVAPLMADVGVLDRVLDGGGGAAGMIWIGPQGSFTPLHHDLTNNLLIQLVGCKRVILVAPGETPKLYNHLHVFSEIADLTAPDLDLARYPRLGELRLHDITLEPGEALFIPIGWWHQVSALDFSVSLTCTNFRWPNDSYRDHPVRG